MSLPPINQPLPPVINQKMECEEEEHHMEVDQLSMDQLNEIEMTLSNREWLLGQWKEALRGISAEELAEMKMRAELQPAVDAVWQELLRERRSLLLSGVQLTPSSAKGIKAGLITAGRLENLLLCDKTLIDESFAEIAEGIAANNSIRHLFLRNNNLGEASAASLAKIIKENLNIFTLDLSNNSLGDKAAVELSKSLEEGRRGKARRIGQIFLIMLKKMKIEAINLSGNQISDAGATSLGKSLLKNHSGKRMNLEKNLMRERGIRDLEGILSGKNMRLVLSSGREKMECEENEVMGPFGLFLNGAEAMRV